MLSCSRCLGGFVRHYIGRVEHFDGLVGAELLKRYRVTLDNPEGRLTLEPASSQPYRNEASGLFVVAALKDFHEFTIVDVDPDRPAGRAGVEEGDRIESVNGAPARSLTLERVRELLDQPRRTVRLMVSRGGRQMEFTLRL